MALVPEIEQIRAAMQEWRRDIHAYPETAFEEVRTAALVAEKLTKFGLDEVHTGIATTGVVGVLRAGPSAAGNQARSIGLRADMDALDVFEKNDFEHRSTHDGKMHACGHDGHTTMLLGAAQHLAQTRRFDGTVYFIFQPAEENEGGGEAMVKAGLFERFPAEGVYGMHNWPGLEVGKMAVRAGPMLAAFDLFEIIVTGKGAHAAMPHLGIDPVVAASHLVTALQTIASRTVDPLQSSVVTVTQFHGGDTWNVIPETVVLRGTSRSFSAEVRDQLESRVSETAERIAAAFGAKAEVRYMRRYPATVNSEAETETAATVASQVVGPDNLDRDPSPTMGSEDFSYMLQEKPGCYILLGNGPGEGGCTLHNPHYDFNDDALAIGASYWARLAEHCLAAPA